MLTMYEPLWVCFLKLLCHVLHSHQHDEVSVAFIILRLRYRSVCQKDVKSALLLEKKLFLFLVGCGDSSLV